MQIALPNEILIEEIAVLLDEGKDVELLARGNSMLPFIIGDSDSVILKKEKDYVPQPGHIVLARRCPGCYVMHRVIAVDGNNVTLKGDGNIRGTEYVSIDNVLGKVIRIVSRTGKGRTPEKALLWRNTGPFVRRCVLAVYRRTILKLLYR